LLTPSQSGIGKLLATVTRRFWQSRDRAFHRFQLVAMDFWFIVHETAFAKLIRLAITSISQITLDLLFQNSPAFFEMKA
jgi:hypothetical protein